MGRRGPISKKQTITKLEQSPRMPSRLSPAAKAHWRRLAPILTEMGLLHPADQTALGRLCSLLANYDSLQQSLLEGGHTREDGVRRPESRACAQVADAIAKLEAQFGLTPASRQRLTLAETNKTVSGKNRFFARSAEIPA